MFLQPSAAPPVRRLLRLRLPFAGIISMVLLGACTRKEAISDSTVAIALDSATRANVEDMAKPDDQMQAVLNQLSAMGGKPIETLTPAEARMRPTPAAAAGMVALSKGMDTTGTVLITGVNVIDRTIPGAAGAIPARVYTPDGIGPFPVVLYIHGGGWVIANKEVYDGGARGIAKRANAVVVSIDYRLAPEHKFPAQHDDAFAAYRWVTLNAASIKGDPARIAIVGESAGGNLAVATAIAARDAKVTMPRAVVAVYPIAQPDTMTTSYVENANAKPLNRPMMGWFAMHATRTPADMQDPRINLIKANLSGLPQVTIINAQIDPLLDDGEMLEKALKSANVDVERKVYDGAAHEFFGMAAVVEKAADAQQYAANRLRSAFEQKK